MKTRPPKAAEGRDMAAELAELEHHADHVAGRLALISNAKRLMILCRLAEGEASVSELQSFVGLSQSALSQHLGRLRAAGMVSTRREAQTIYYSLADEEIRTLMAALYKIFCGPASLLGRR